MVTDTVKWNRRRNDILFDQKTKLYSILAFLSAIGLNVLQMLGIKKDTVTLLDPLCRAQDNGTHIYIQTSQDSCGTNFIDSQQGKMAYINTVSTLSA